jgi:hypothetical protein
MTELRHLAYALRDPLLWAAVLLSLLLSTLAYQLPFSYTLEVASSDAAPYLTNFYPPQDVEGRAARWSHAYSYITLPGTGGNRQLRVVVEYNASRAGVSSPPPVTVSGIVGGEELYRQKWQPPAGWQMMRLDVDAAHPLALEQRDLQIELRTDVYRPPDYQGNELGVLVSRVTIAPLPGAPWQPVIPNVRIMALVGVLVLGVYLLVARIAAIRPGLRSIRRFAAVSAGLIGLAVAGGIALSVVELSRVLLPITWMVYGGYFALAIVVHTWPRTASLLAREARALSAAIRYRPLVALMLLSPIAFSFGLQAPLDYEIDIGSGHDAPFIRDFNHSMFPLPGGTPGDYRTTSAHSYITIPGVGSDNVYSVTLRLAPGAGAASRGEIRVLVNGAEATRWRLVPGWQDVTFSAGSGPARAFNAANLEIEILAPAELVEGGEQRGVLVDRIEIAHSDTAAPFSRSPAHEAGLLAGVMLLYLLVVRFAGLRPTLPARRLALLAAAPTVVVLAWGLRIHRVDILLALPHLLVTLLGGYLLLVVGNRQSVTASRLPVSRYWLPILALAFILRYGFSGLPQLNVVDLPYHLKWLNVLIGGDFGRLYFPGELSSVPPEWSLNVLIPKSPLFYVVMWPLGLFRGLDLGPAMLFVVSLMDAAMVPVIFALAARVERRWRGSWQSWSWWAALAYAVMPLAFRALAFGILPTIFAQTLTLLALALPTLWPERLRRPAWLVGWVLLLAGSLVAFPTALAFNTPVVIVLALGWAWRRAAPPRTPVLMLGGLGAAVVLSFAAYYQLYVGPFLTRTLPALAGGTTVRGKELWPGGPLEMLGWSAGYVVNWFPLLLLPIAILYLWRPSNQKGELGSPQSSRLWVLLIAWLGVLLVGLLLNLRFDMIGKHLYYTVPAGALAAGLVLSRLWLRGLGRPYARWLAVLAGLSLAWATLAFMAERL